MLPKDRTILRKLFDVSNAVTVHVTPDAHPPELTGECGYWTTPSGKTRVYHPSAYSKKGRCVYHRTTQEIRVGVIWLLGHYPEIGARVTVQRLSGGGLC